MAHKIVLPSGNKIEVEASKQNLINYELVYSVDTEELAIKLNNEVVYLGKVVNWDDIENKPDLPDLDYLEDELNNLKIELENYIDNKDAAVLQEAKDYTYDRDTIDSKDTNTLNIAKSYADSLVPDLSGIEQDITNLEEEVEDIKEDYVTKVALDLQLLEKLAIKPNGTDLLVIDGKINSVYIDSLYATDIEVVDTVAEMLTLPNMKRGDIAIVTETETTYILKQEPSNVLGNWVQFLSKPEVISVNGKTGIVHIGISDIDNLQSILNSKLDVTTYENDIVIIETTFNNHIINESNPHKVTSEQVGTYEKDTIDSKDASTLQEAKDYTDDKISFASNSYLLNALCWVGDCLTSTEQDLINALEWI